ARVPCVSTRLAGVPEMVEEGVTGFLVEEGDTVAFAEALRKLLTDQEHARCLGEAGQARARRLFSLAGNGRLLLELLVSRGRVAFDAALVRQHPALAAAYGRQLPLRFKPLAPSKSRQEVPPDFLTA